MGGVIKECYVPKTVKAKLGYLIEECGETMAAVGKSQRWGLDGYNPEIPTNDIELNRQWIKRELHDLKRAIKYVEESI